MSEEDRVYSCINKDSDACLEHIRNCERLGIPPELYCEGCIYYETEEEPREDPFDELRKKCREDPYFGDFYYKEDVEEWIENIGREALEKAEKFDWINEWIKDNFPNLPLHSTEEVRQLIEKAEKWDRIKLTQPVEALIELGYDYEELREPVKKALSLPQPQIPPVLQENDGRNLTPEFYEWATILVPQYFLEIRRILEGEEE